MTAVPTLEAGPAVLSEDRRYRYRLSRSWERPGENVSVVTFVGLNPSTADENTLDPTLRRCLRFAMDWGHNAFCMLNLFAYRATNPLDMKAQGLDAIGPLNDEHLIWAATHSATVVAAWGAHGGWLGRDSEVLKLLGAEGVELHCLGRTRDGMPRHPLYMKRDTPLIPYTGSSS